MITHKERLTFILNGIDRVETDGEGGWWETSMGAAFGAVKLNKLEALLAEVRSDALQEAADECKKLACTMHASRTALECATAIERLK